MTNKKMNWNITTDINKTTNLFSISNIKLPYIVESYLCSCGEIQHIIKYEDQILDPYICQNCDNKDFTSSKLYLNNSFWYKPFEKSLTKDIQNYLEIEIINDEVPSRITCQVYWDIPMLVDIGSDEIKYHKQIFYEVTLGNSLELIENLHVNFDLEKYLDSSSYWFDEYNEAKLINKHPILIALKSQILKMLIKHPFMKDVALVKYGCQDIKELLFFRRYTHLKEYDFLYWKSIELLPSNNSLTITDGFNYVLDYRKEKTLKKAVYDNYKFQVETYKNYSFLFQYFVCRFIQDVNIAIKLIKLDFEFNYNDFYDTSGFENLFLYLTKNYQDRQIYTLFQKFTQDKYLLLDVLEMFSEFDSDLLENLEKFPLNHIKFHDSLVKHHRLLAYNKLLQIEFDYEKRFQKACTTLQQYTINLPQNGLELYRWSNALSNCLSGYGDRIKYKICTVFGVFEDDTIKIAIEIQNDKIIQARSKYNQRAEPQDLELILSWHEKYFVKKDSEKENIE